MEPRDPVLADAEQPPPAVLIIDDDANNLAIVSSLLEECRYTIFVAEDGESGISRAVLAKPDLILLDVMMPGLDGFETCRRLKGSEATRDIPVIFMTALSQPDQKITGFRCGAVDYVTKPLQREELLARVGVHLGLRALAKSLQQANDSLERRVEERTAELARTNDELQREIEERKTTQEALAANQRDLEALNAHLEERVLEEVAKNQEKDRMLFQSARLAAMTELLNNIAHQWRQPLNNIALLIQEADVSYRGGVLEVNTFADYVNRCMDMIGYLSKTINVFQSVFMTGSPRKVFDPFEMVRKAHALVQTTYEQMGIVINVVNGGMQPVAGVDTEFSQVILHILNNAKDALLKWGTPEPAVEVRCRCEGGRDVITIQDNAGGVPEEIIDKIFDPYFTTKFQSPGTGIALYLCKMTIEQGMGGTLSVSNKLNGAEFRIELPVAPEDVSP
ncbi:hybrid sensor histidine kinase/response regulator [Geomonas azotofigens]|uniref:hybrid sensor histidine kinase/response regulator n=1 Tax=Geomonas azotofigens TaxID=2843196 RepID=UPI001C109AA8|nr:response regulator [Geomonas azotofigens]MBU5613894.1 response regulator [Geomonas azotofigens]